jgi:hypothetical protein
MKKTSLIAIITAAHFVLCMTLLGLIRLAGFLSLKMLYLWLIFPLNLFPNLLPHSFYLDSFYLYWFTLILAVALDSAIWGVVLGFLIYAVRPRHRKLVA